MSKPRAAAVRLPTVITAPTPARLVEAWARAGYAARGMLYVSMGVVALAAALEWRASPADGRGALVALAEGPVGYLWLTGIALGLAGFALWRAAQVVLDADRQGNRWLAIGSRAGQALSGLIYGGLALSLFELLDEIEDRDEAHEEVRAQAAEVLAWPGGDLLLIGVGLFIVGCGVGNILQAVFARLGARLECEDWTWRWARWFGRTGYLARGVAFLPLGAFLVEAGLDMDAGRARDFGGALQSLESQPFGGLVLALTAIGLIAFGVFALAEARYRRIEPPIRRLSVVGRRLRRLVPLR